MACGICRKEGHYRTTCPQRVITSLAGSSNTNHSIDHSKKENQNNNNNNSGRNDHQKQHHKHSYRGHRYATRYQATTTTTTTTTTEKNRQKRRNVHTSSSPVVVESIVTPVGENEINVLSVNGDWSNRSAELSDQTSLSNHMISVFNKFSMNLGVVSEVRAGSSKEILSRSGYGGKITKPGYDHMVLLWSPNFDVVERFRSRSSKNFIGEYYESKEGKYSGVILEHENYALAFFGIHSPRKQVNKRKESYRLLSKCIETCRDYVDDVIVAGDFNGNKREISEYIKGNYAFDCPTTKSNMALDNIITQSSEYRKTLVDRSCPLLSHYPINGVVKKLY